MGPRVCCLPGEGQLEQRAVPTRALADPQSQPRGRAPEGCVINSRNPATRWAWPPETSNEHQDCQEGRPALLPQGTQLQQHAAGEEQTQTKGCGDLCTGLLLEPRGGYHQRGRKEMTHRSLSLPLKEGSAFFQDRGDGCQQANLCLKVICSFLH